MISQAAANCPTSVWHRVSTLITGTVLNARHHTRVLTLSRVNPPEGNAHRGTGGQLLEPGGGLLNSPALCKAVSSPYKQQLLGQEADAWTPIPSFPQNFYSHERLRLMRTCGSHPLEHVASLHMEYRVVHIADVLTTRPVPTARLM